MKAKIFLCSLAIIFSGVLMLSSSAVARMACDPECLARMQRMLLKGALTHARKISRLQKMLVAT